MAPIEEGIKNFVRRAVITTDPQKAFTEFLLSKQEERNVKKYPEWDKPRNFPASQVVRAHCDLAKVEEKLHAKWAEWEKHQEHLNKKWEEIRSQELILRESFIKFNRFVRENHDKRDRAKLKIKEERERQRIRQNEVEELIDKLCYLKDVREKMKKHVGLYKKYQTYLERVLVETGEFQSIGEIFNRYETLIEARSILSDQQNKNLATLEETGVEIYHMTEIKTQKFMGLNTKLAQLQGRRDRAEAKALKWEMIVSRIKASIAEKNLKHTQVKTCCWNLYQQICKRKGIPVTVSKEDVEQQLDHIKRTILELKRIIKVAKKWTAKEVR